MTTEKITLNALSRLVRDKHQVTRQEAADYVKAFFTTITKTLVAEGEVNVPSTMKFKVRHKAARIGRNPKTGENHTIQPRNTLVLKVSPNCGEPLGETGGHTSSLFVAAKKEGCPLEVSTTIVNQIGEAVANQVQLEIRGFGSIHYSHQASRLGRNPKTGEPVMIEASVRALIRTSPSLMAAL